MPSTLLWNVPDLPPNFLPRAADLEGLRNKLLAIEQSVVMTGSSTGVTVQGMGGIGKSVLAAAVVQDAIVQQAFPDGIFWLTLGQEPKLLELQTELFRALGEEQPTFSQVQQGKTELKSLLRSKACLLVLDDIWNIADLGALDVVGQRGQRLITTRNTRIGASISAVEHRLDVLSQTQARQLLAQWTQFAEPDLPVESNAVAQECGYLPLALSMVGAMLRGKPDRWSNVLHRLQSADLDKIRQQFPDYPYPDLLKAIQVSVDALEPELQQRYLDFAVFPEDTPVPEAVLQTFWQPEGLDEYDTQDAIDALADRSLLRRDEQGRVTLHDLQRDFVRRQAGKTLAELHQRWLDAYQQQCKAGWHTGPDDGYFFQWLPWHLKEANRADALKALLLDYGWLETALAVTGTNGLIADYDLLPQEKSLKLVQNALRLSAHVLAKEPQHLTGRLLGHLLHQPQPEIRQLLAQAQQQQAPPWLRPLTANLTAPDGPLLRTLEGHSDSINSIALLPDGKRAISASNDHTLKLWDLEQGTVLRSLEGHSGMVWSVAVTPDGKRAISGAYSGTLKLWDLEQGVELWTLEGHSGNVRSIAVTPDGRQLISASDDCKLKLWDLEQGMLLRSLEGHSEEVWSVAVLPDGRRAISGSKDCTLKLWDLAQGTVLRTLEADSSIPSVAVFPNGKQALSGSDDGTLKLWDLAQGIMLQTLEGHSDRVNALAIAPDGKRVVSGAADCKLKLWDLEQGTVIQTLEGHSDYVWSVAIVPDGQRAVSVAYDSTLKLWDLAHHAVPQMLEGHSDWVFSLAITPDGKRAIAASGDDTLKLWDLEQGLVLQILKGHSNTARSVAMLPDGKRAISGAYDCTLKLWDLAQGVVLQTLQGHSDMVWSVAVTPDGSRAVSGSVDHTVKVWDLATGVVLHTLEGHSDNVNSVAVLPDGRRAISASYDRTLKLWDIEQGALLQTLEGHSDGVWSVAVTPDGRRAVSGSYDRTLKVWDLAQGMLLQTLDGESNWSFAIAVSPDGKHLISGAYDGTLKLWDLQTGKGIASFRSDRSIYACAIAPDGLTVVAGTAGGGVHRFKISTL